MSKKLWLLILINCNFILANHNFGVVVHGGAGVLSNLSKEQQLVIEQKVSEVITQVGLRDEHLRRYPHSFSGGQRQRIGIARSLIISPKVIICDEAVSALDVSVQAQIINLLKELQARYNYSYIFISHDLSVVKYMSDRMVVMQAGKIEEMGDADQIYNSPQTAYTKN